MRCRPHAQTAQQPPNLNDLCLNDLSGGLKAVPLPQDLPEGNYMDLKKKGIKEKANTLREMKVAFRCGSCKCQGV